MNWLYQVIFMLFVVGFVLSSFNKLIVTFFLLFLFHKKNWGAFEAIFSLVNFSVAIYLCHVLTCDVFYSSSAYFCLQNFYSIFSLCIGVKDLLQNISEKQGKRMNSHESAKDIPKFIEFFKVRTLCFYSLVRILVLYSITKLGVNEEKKACAPIYTMHTKGLNFENTCDCNNN